MNTLSSPSSTACPVCTTRRDRRAGRRGARQTSGAACVVPRRNPDASRDAPPAPTGLRLFHLVVVTAVLVLLAPLEAAAQGYTGCLTFVRNLKTTASCIGDPGFDKYFEATKVHWTDGTPYLVVNTGNDLDFFDISIPQNPTPATGSNFWHWGFNFGDSDYDLINYTLCDGCRYGMSNYKLGTFVFDLGTGGEPQFSSTAYMYDPVMIGASAGFTFSHAGSQYIIGTDLTMGSCANGIPVYRMTGVTPGNLTKAGCVPLADAPVGWGIQNGIELAGDYVGLASSTGNMLVFLVAGSGTSLSFTQVDPLLLGGVGRNVGSVADLTLKLALLTKVGQPARLYSLSSTAPPATLLNEHSANANLAALGGGILFAARAYYPGSEALYKIDDFIHSPSPPALSPDFWSDAWSWNQNDCEKPTGAVVSDDGSTLYTTNYSVVKIIDAIPCGVPVQPIANFVIAPATAFPGDGVTVTNTSSGGSRTAIWVTDTSDPSSTLRFGSRTMSSSTTPLAFTVPQNLPASQDYWAHVAVENDDFQCDPVSDPDGCGNQLATKHVVIDRTPLVTGIGYEPTAPLRDDTVAFTASAEGTPSSWTWDVVSPGGHHTTGSGNPMVPTVHLDESDTWSATVTAHYLHSGGTYADSETITLDISSVAAAFTVPSDPINTDPITLDGSSSRSAPDATLSYDWTVTGPTPYTGCPHTELCTIPADTLTAGTYTVRLTLRDTSTGDSSTAPNQYMTVEDGAIYPDFNWSPASPQIGQLVAFNITGVPGDIDQADWDFGDIGCRGFDQLTTCTPMFFPYCMTQSYRFAYSGPKTVSVTVTIDGEQYTSPPHTVTVQATGVCAQPPCTYNTAPTTFSLPFTGSSGTVQVTTDADCTWQAVANAPWLHVTAGSSGTGDGEVSFTADPNPGDARSGTLTVAGHTITVTQPAFVVIDFAWYPAQPERGETVTFTVSPDMEPLSWDFGSADCAGRSRVVDCTSDPAACRTIQWTYPTDGPHDVTLTISSGGRTRTVSVQDQGACAGNCAYALSPATRLLPASAGSTAFDIVTGAGCPWTAASAQDWATITSALSGAGPATVTYHVTANAGAARAGAIAVAGLRHTLQQQDAYPPGDCTQAGPHDDGTFENAYGWSEADTLVERYTPPAYPALYTGVCVAWTRSGGDQALDYDVVFMDDDGAGGGPGTVLGTAPGSAAGVPSWPDAVLVPDDVAGAAPPVTGGSVWVGVAWDDSTDSGFSVAADESPTTPANQGLFRQDGGPWLTIASQHPAYRALFVRPVAGAGPPAAPGRSWSAGPEAAATASATPATLPPPRRRSSATTSTWAPPAPTITPPSCGRARTGCPGAGPRARASATP